MRGIGPVQFLVAVGGIWVAARGLLLIAPIMGSGTGAPPGRQAAQHAVRPAAVVAAAPLPVAQAVITTAPTPLLAARVGGATPNRLHLHISTRPIDPPALTPGRGLPASIANRTAIATAAIGNPLVPLTASAAAVSRPSRWSGSAWLFAREGSGPQLATGGTLGGSQAGARLLYRLDDDPARPLSISARVSGPLESRGAEAALGIEYKPSATLPVHILVERRQALQREGRSAFALLAYGGILDRKLAGPVLLDAYAQAGMVGLNSRDLFADGAARISIAPAENLKIGGGLWAAAQPGVARIDIGPQASIRLPLRRASVSLSAEWRLRIAGDATPASGPAVTLSTGF